MENPSNEGFLFLKLSEVKQLKSFVRIRRNFKAKKALNYKEWHVSLVKLHYFQFAFLENCVYKKQKKSIKNQRIF